MIITIYSKSFIKILKYLLLTLDKYIYLYYNIVSKDIEQNYKAIKNKGGLNL